MNNDLELLLAEIDFLKSDLGLQSYLPGDKLLEALAVEYTFESNRLEGSTLTKPETELAIKIGLMISGKTMAEYLAAINHNQAVQFIREQAGEMALVSEDLIKEIHSILLRGINPDQRGIYRAHPVKNVKGYSPPAANQLPGLMTYMVEWLRVEGPFLHPIIFAAEAHQRLLSLQPFSEANGACARLLMNLILLEEGYPLANFSGTEPARSVYFNTLEQAHSQTDKSGWHKLVAEQVMSDIKSLLKRLNDIQGDGLDG